MFLAASLVAFGVSVKKLFAETIKYPDDPLTAEYRLLFTVSVVIFLVALALIDYGLDDKLTAQRQVTNVLIHLVGAVVVLGVGLLVTAATATQFAAIIAVIMVAQVGFSIYQSVSAPEHQSAAK